MKLRDKSLSEVKMRSQNRNFNNVYLDKFIVNEESKTVSYMDNSKSETAGGMKQKLNVEDFLKSVRGLESINRDTQEPINKVTTLSNHIPSSRIRNKSNITRNTSTNKLAKNSSSILTKSFITHKRSKSNQLSMIINNQSRRINLKEIKEKMREEELRNGGSYNANSQDISNSSNIQSLRKEFLNQLIYSKRKETGKEMRNSKNVLGKDSNIIEVRKNITKEMNDTNEQTLLLDKTLPNQKFSNERLLQSQSIQLEINPSFEEQKLDLLSKKIPQLIQILNQETENVQDKKEFIKNKYKLFLENFQK